MPIEPMNHIFLSPRHSILVSNENYPYENCIGRGWLCLGGDLPFVVFKSANGPRLEVVGRPSRAIADVAGVAVSV